MSPSCCRTRHNPPEGPQQGIILHQYVHFCSILLQSHITVFVGLNCILIHFLLIDIHDVSILYHNNAETDIFVIIPCGNNLDINFWNAWIKGYVHFTFQFVSPSVFFRGGLNASSQHQCMNTPVSAPNHQYDELQSLDLGQSDR